MVDVQQQENQQQQQQFNPTEARTFLQSFGHDVTTIDEAKLPEVYTKVKGGADKLVSTAVEAAIKERGTFGPDWREQLAKGDDKKLETLKRYATPQAYADAGFELRTKISKGELKSNAPFPDKGTAEEQTAWRKEQGIPEKPEGYEVKPPTGVVIGEADKPFITGFLEHAHKNNMSPAGVNAAVAWWGEERIRRQEAAAEQTTTLKRETEDKLRATWGAEYRPIMTKIEGLLDANITAGSDLKESLMNTVAINEGFANLLANLAQQIDPHSTLTPNGGEDKLGSITDWLAESDALMRTDRKKYNETRAKDYARYAAAYQKQSGKEWGKKA